MSIIGGNAQRVTGGGDIASVAYQIAAVQQKRFEETIQRVAEKQEKAVDEIAEKAVSSKKDVVELSSASKAVNKVEAAIAADTQSDNKPANTPSSGANLDVVV